MKANNNDDLLKIGMLKTTWCSIKSKLVVNINTKEYPVMSFDKDLKDCYINMSNSTSR